MKTAWAWDATTVVRALVWSLFGVVFAVGGCSAADEPAAGDPYYDEHGVTPFDSEGMLGKADNAGIPGPSGSFDGGDTAVWAVKNQWEDRNTTAAKEAGLAWAANSGLNWDEKYARWIDSMKKIPGHSTWGGDTFELTTPWGKTLPAPKLECAEVAMFLRVTFAAWYNLPFYMTTTDQSGTRVFFGHMGSITGSGVYKNMPRYKAVYKDHSALTPAQYQANWPKDTSLRNKGLYGGGDDMSYLFEGAKAGGYMDEVHLNKRVGHFTLHLLSYFGSANLANSRNTFNLKPEALREGDVLVERWQKQGIGHTLVVKQVEPIAGGRLDAQLVSGSMPRRQPKWEDSISSKRSFTDERAGGPGTNSAGDKYAALGGGLKRFRVAKLWSGSWTNTWMNADEANWVNDTDLDAIAERTSKFETLLGEVSPAELRDALVGIINDARKHLENYPASCSARTKRENAWRELYTLLQDKFGVSKAQADAQYRTLADYVFAELEYDQSKTCCWNSTNNAMYQIAMNYNESLQQSACTAPVVFKNTNGGYQVFATYAAQNGQGAQWKAWTEDEPCAQRDVQNDTEKAHGWVAWCDLPSNGGGGTGGTGGTGGSGGAGGSGGTAGSGGSGGSGGASCVGHCGENTPVPGSSCYCDSYCVQNSDCCADYASACN